MTDSNQGFAIYKLMQWFALIMVLTADDMQMLNRLRKEIELHYQIRTLIKKRLDLSYLAFFQLSTREMAIYRTLMTPKISQPFRINRQMLEWELISHFGK
jgi:hypothetical protein